MTDARPPLADQARREQAWQPIRALVAKWRGDARRWRTTGEAIDIATAETAENDADELDALLPRVSALEPSDG